MATPGSGGGSGGTINLEGLGLDDSAKKRVENILKAAIDGEVETNPALNLATADWKLSFSKTAAA